MRSWLSRLSTAILFVCAFGIGPARAAELITYTGTHHVGAATVTISITTDGTLGDVAQSNVRGIFVTLSGPTGSTSLRAFNSTMYEGETATGVLNMASFMTFYATADTISLLYPTTTFTPGLSNHEIGIHATAAYGGYSNYYSFGGGSGYNYQYGEYVNIDGVQYSGPITGDFTVARVGGFNDQASPAPEPATWAMMLVGFGAVGTGLRRARKPALA